MFAMILRTTWAWTRVSVATISVTVLLAPTLFLRGATDPGLPMGGGTLIDAVGALNLPLTLLAIIGPFVLAAQPWAVDAEAKHVYALSLPITWPRYVAMRFGAGVTTLLVPALALFIGLQLLLQRVTVPEELNAYPFALTLRFLLAMLVAYSATFALQYLAGRRAPLVLLVTLLSIGALSAVSTIVGSTDWLEAVARAFAEWPGPLAIFFETWVLLDV